MKIHPQSIDELEDLLSEPTPEVVETLRSLQGDIIILGASGKIGPTLTRMVKRANAAAGCKRRIVAVARFKSDKEFQKLQDQGIETVRCDLLDRSAVAKLPQIENVIYLPGFKFGTEGQAGTTWAVNTYLAGVVCEHFRASRIAALSTGNVYGLSAARAGGSREEDPLNPVGEYAASCLGRERMFEYFSDKDKIPVSIVRLFYACDLRYGVLVDLAKKVQAGEPIRLEMRSFNIIWQRDCNALIIRSLAHASSPPFMINITGPETLSIRESAEQLGQMLGKTPRFEGTEADTVLLGNTDKSNALFGRPNTPASELLEAVGEWIKRGGNTLGKPTGFEVRDGKF